MEKLGQESKTDFCHQRDFKLSKITSDVKSVWPRLVVINNLKLLKFNC